ncbi:DUF2535 family protein [Priestia filamentosa]|uniref:DUF2535 family protein n=1 Tax=Priestia filamentosa TaxID=1402861 RepID=UPI0039823A5A
MLFKSLEFKLANGQKVKVIEIPVVPHHHPLSFMISVHFESFVKMIERKEIRNELYSFKEYMKKHCKWTTYEQIFLTVPLKHNA